MRKWKKYLAAAFVATLTVGTMSSIVPGRVEKVQAADETVTATLPLDDSVVWKYSDDNTDPAGDEENANYNRTSWTVEDFDDSEWKTNEGNTAIFGVKSGTSLELDNGYTATVLLNHYIDGSAAPVIPAYFFRTKFNLEEQLIQ